MTITAKGNVHECKRLASSAAQPPEVFPAQQSEKRHFNVSSANHILVGTNKPVGGGTSSTTGGFLPSWLINRQRCEQAGSTDEPRAAKLSEAAHLASPRAAEFRRKAETSFSEVLLQKSKLSTCDALFFCKLGSQRQLSASPHLKPVKVLIVDRNWGIHQKA